MPENDDEKLKRSKIEAALSNPNTTLWQWQEFAKSDYGLINGKIIIPIVVKQTNEQ